MSKFSAYRIFKEGDSSFGRFTDLTLDDLDPGEVVIRVHYSAVNYKDTLAATGAGKVIRRFPCVGGVDAAGIVESSSDTRFQPGDKVLVTGYEMGVAHDGGFAEFVRVPADWVVPLPVNLSLFEAMALGTAGFTAALAIHRLEQNELTPDKGKVIVTGATGGVSSIAIQMLSQLGYQVVAMTGKDSEHEYLKALGASEILPRKSVELTSTRPMERAQWAGALDSVGGDTLSWLTRSMLQNGAIASYGNAGGLELHTNVFPFILRGVKLLGVDSAATQMTLRKQMWQRLAGDSSTGLRTGLKPRNFDLFVHTVPFAGLETVFPTMLKGETRGRTVVQIAGS